MAVFEFATKIYEGDELTPYDYPLLARDFTYIDDIVDGVIAVMGRVRHLLFFSFFFPFPLFFSSSRSVLSFMSPHLDFETGAPSREAFMQWGGWARARSGRGGGAGSSRVLGSWSDQAIPSRQAFSFELYNLGSASPARITSLIGMLETELGKKSRIRKRPLPRSESKSSWADITKA